MFNKLKQIRDLRQRAKSLQNQFAEQVISTDSNWGKLKMTIDGNMEMKSLSIDDSLMGRENRATLEKDLINLFNNSVKKAQKAIASVMSKDGGLSNIADMLK